MKDQQTQVKDNAEKCEHVADLSSASIGYESGVVFVNVKCAKCGHRGCIAEIRSGTEVNWHMEMMDFGFTNDRSRLEKAAAWRDAAIADGWDHKQYFVSEPEERGCKLTKEGFVCSILTREGGIGPKFKYQVSIHIWGPDKLCIIPPDEYDWNGIKAGVNTCNYCGAVGVATECVAFAGRACSVCQPKEQAKLSPNWSA